MPRIYVLSGPDVGKHFEVQGGATLGRSAECAVHLRDASVSRVHARIEVGAAGFELVDNQSRNGVRSNGQKVERCTLVDGVEFEVGEVLLRFRADAVAASASTTPTATAPRSTPKPAPTESPLDVAPRVADTVREEPKLADRSVPVPAPAASRSPAPSDVEFDDEIELEGDWTAPASTPAQTPEPVIARAASRASTPSPREEPEAAPRAAERRAPPVLRPSTSPMPRSTDPTSNRAVLQFHKVEQKEGFLGADLGQQPIWIKALAVIVGLALFAGIFWLAFKGTSILRGHPVEPTAEETTEGTPQAR